MSSGNDGLSYRTDPAPGERIDRGRTLRFTFDGESLDGHDGDTIASALAATGITVLSRSFKYHRPRGLLCCSGACPNCLVQVEKEPNVRACVRRLEEGMRVRSQNAWPSLKRDLLSWFGKAGRFMPVGFYYKTFMRPASMWPFFERILRRAAGLGTVDVTSLPASYGKEYLHAQVTVVGGGPAGLTAALAAADGGASTLLLDDQTELGGHLRYSRPGGSAAAELRQRVVEHEGIRVFSQTEAIGWYMGNWIAAQQDDRLLKIRTSALVLASGVHENPLLFDNNDLPGVMLGSGVQRLLHLYGVSPARRVLIVAANDDGWTVAADLRRSGVEVVAVADERETSESPLVAALEARGVRCLFRHTIVRARGGNHVTGAQVAPLDVEGNVDFNAVSELDCDSIVISVGWTPALELLHMAGGATRYDEGRCEFSVSRLPPGIFVAGRANGGHNLEWQMQDGTYAGRAAAVFCGASQGLPSEVPSRPSEPRRTSPRVVIPGGKKRFLCLCEDVTNHDLETALQEGYDSIELLKRYSTLSMGPCQGKMCSANAIHLCARVCNRSVAETGRTTSRPPVSPVSLGVLAGQRMEPVRLGALHDWHFRHGAVMMVAGSWLRPEHYGAPTDEVRSVRQDVGIIDVSTLGKYRLTGPGVPRFLERVYVNQWRKLDVNRVRYGIMCNDEGVVMDDGVCAHVDDAEWYLSTTSSGASGVEQWLQWWIQSGWGDGVHLVDLTDQYSAFNLAGPLSRQVLQQLTTAALGNESLPYMSTRQLSIDGISCRLLRIGFTGELSYEIHCPSGFAQHLWEAIMEAGSDCSIQPFGVEAQRILRLEKGHIIVGQDTDAISDPLSANMAWAVKLKKRDFLGKRELVRIAAEGPKQLLVGFKMDRSRPTPDEGMQIVERNDSGDLEILGWVTSSRFSPTLGESIGLCWLPRERAEQEGAPFQIYMDGTFEGARVFHGPFYDPAGEKLRS